MQNNPELQMQLIGKFLIEFKTLISDEKWNIIERRKNYAATFELTIESIKTILMELTIDDYVSGPEEDRDRPGEYVWKFGKDIEDKQFYIKLKIVDNKEARVISFHSAERKLRNKRF